MREKQREETNEINNGRNKQMIYKKEKIKKKHSMYADKN
jgi:hypothetical protein